MRSLSFGNSLAESTLLTGLEIAFVHSPSPAEAQSQPDYQERRHPVMGSKDKNISFSVQSHLDATPGRANQTTVQELGNRQHTQTDFGLYAMVLKRWKIAPENVTGSYTITHFLTQHTVRILTRSTPLSSPQTLVLQLKTHSQPYCKNPDEGMCSDCRQGKEAVKANAIS